MKIFGTEINKKWFENYWFYYKTHTIAGVFALLIIIYSVVECANNVKPDATVTYVGSSYFAEEYIAAFEQELSGYIDDIDGDGNKNAMFTPLTVPEEVKSEQDIAMQQKIQIELAVGETYLYILDKKYFDLYNEQDLFLDISGYAGMPSPVYGIKAGESPVLRSLGISKDDEMYVAVRILTMGDEKKEKKVAAQENAIKILQYLYE